MATHRSVRRFKAPAEDCFAVAADVGAYSEFLPLLKRSAIRGVRERLPTGERFVAELAVSHDKLALRETFAAQVITDHIAKTVAATSQDGPFKMFGARWSFKDVAGGCDASLEIEYAFKSLVLQIAAGGLIDHAVNKILMTFEERVVRLGVEASKLTSS